MTDHHEMPHRKAFAAQTNVHRHETGADAVAAATERARNTTIVIGADQKRGVLLLDIDVQADVCRDAKELQDQLRLIIDALDGYDPLGDA